MLHHGADDAECAAPQVDGVERDAAWAGVRLPCSAVESRSETWSHRHAVRDLVEKMFGGSSEELVMELR